MHTLRELLGKKNNVLFAEIELAIRKRKVILVPLILIWEYKKVRFYYGLLEKGSYICMF